MEAKGNRQEPEAPGEESEEWAQRLRRGQSEAVRQVRLRVKRILGYQRLRIPPQEREDLEQQIVTEVWQTVNRGGFDLSAGFWGFVDVVSSRRCIDWLRIRRRDLDSLDLQIPDRRSDPLQRTLREERSKWAAEILASLEPPCRELIMMRFRDGLPYNRIADELGKSDGAVRVQMYRCIRRARQFLDHAKVAPRRREGAGEEP